MLPKRIRFYSMHHFTISTFEIVPQLNDNIRTQVNKGKGYQEIRTVKTFEFKNKRGDAIKWDKLFKNGSNKICERQLLKNSTGYGLL